MSATELDEWGRSLAPLGDDDVVLRRTRRRNAESADSESVIAVTERLPSGVLGKLAHEFELGSFLQSDWALRPLELIHDKGRATLLLEDPGGELLSHLLVAPMEIETFLGHAITIAAAISKMHQHGLIHKDIKPSHILVDLATQRVWLTGFGIASRLPRERQPTEPPANIAGTLAYMAPEQTGRMNRSIDSRSDLYALGVTYYQMLTGMLPFTATDPMEWVHCHVARWPLAPSRRRAAVPLPLSDIVMKLLAKTAEDRYQTAAGVERDLRRCLEEWRINGYIDSFALGEIDASDRLTVAEKLYGRGEEVKILLDAFDRIVAGGRPELMLISGYSGIGKSAVVNELHKALVPFRGHFASGKFDQYKRDIPYATLAQAFQSLIRPLLGKSEIELQSWRSRLNEALGPHGALIANLAPALELILGDQPPVPPLPSRDAQARFQLVCRKFLGLFATKERPLVLFLDDLHWLDLATLDLLEDLMSQTEITNLLLIGAYRDNEVDRLDPLVRKIEAIRESGAAIQEIFLKPITREDLTTLVAEALHCKPLSGVEPLAHLVHTKSGGNPFFAIQFLSTLADDGLLSFDRGSGRWSWDLPRIRDRGYTDNVIDLMIAKLERLPLATLENLQEFACLGNRADVATLALLHATSEEEVHRELWAAQRLEFIMYSQGAYKFVHDRIQEAAYSLIPEQQRPHTHLRIGRLLAAHAAPRQRAEVIFDIVSQLNRGAILIVSEDEREQLAEFNLIAGNRARASAAYASALTFFAAGAMQISSALWRRRHDLAFALEFHRAECEFLTGELAQAEERLGFLAARSSHTVERARVASLRIDLYTVLDETDAVVAAALDYLRHLGLDWSAHPSDEDARREYDQIWTLLGDRTIKDIADLPLMTDQESLATLDVLTKMFPTATLIDANLLCITVCRAINLSLVGGNGDASCVAYVHFGTVAGPRFGNYEAGFAFGQVGYDLVEHRDLRRFQARTYHWLAQYVLPWNSPLKTCRSLTHRAREAAMRTGDLGVAVYSFDILNTHLFAAGAPLHEAQRQAESGLEFSRKARFGHQIDVQATQLGLVKSLRGLTYKFGEFDDELYSEAELELHASPHPAVYWIRKLQGRFFAGDYATALDAAAKARPKLWTLAGMFETAEYHFYAALSYAGSHPTGLSGENAADPRSRSLPDDLGALASHQSQLERWSELCAENFECRAALVGAELARLQNRELEAERLYERSIRSARSSGFVHIEALAYELSARFYAGRGMDEFALLYLRNARARYVLWGAEGKVRQLENVFPQLGREESSSGPMSTIGTTAERLDLSTVIKASQAVSSEILPDKLIVALMRTVVEHAGAQRGVLIVARGDEYRIEAEVTTDDNETVVQLQEAPLAGFALPETIVHFVARTGEIVAVDDTRAGSSFSADPYLRQRQTRSILCLPLIKQTVLVGMLYLENNLAARVFTPARVSLLELIASQAAISLENTRLYSELEEREGKIRRLVDANIMGVFIWNDGGEIVEANDAFLRIVGYDRADLSDGKVRWAELIPPPWRDGNEGAASQLAADAVRPPREQEFFRKDGSRAPVLVGSAAYGGRRDEGVAFVIDLTERKQAEAHARETERRYQEVKLELEHANRIASIGQLSASIAHEVNQPIAASITNAQTALRWLEAKPPNPEKAKLAIKRIVENGNRAGEVIAGIRALVRKDPPKQNAIAMNDIVLEVVNLARGETAKQNVSVRMQLTKRLPIIRGDKVQLQQVILNLVINAVEAMADVSDGARELVVSTRAAETEGALVSVADSGPGLASGWSERMFEAFNTTKSSGLGMGLAICRAIVEAHGGRLWATANAPRGAVFHFTVPVSPD